MKLSLSNIQNLFGRYKILAPNEMKTIKDEKQAAKTCFDKSGLDVELYRLGKTKVRLLQS